mgnify:CR=1 FL=1
MAAQSKYEHEYNEQGLLEEEPMVIEFEHMEWDELGVEGWVIRAPPDADMEHLEENARDTLIIEKREGVACIMMWGSNVVEGLPDGEEVIGYVIHEGEEAIIDGIAQSMPVPQMLVDYKRKIIHYPWGKVLDCDTGMLMD